MPERRRRGDTAYNLGGSTANERAYEYARKRKASVRRRHLPHLELDPPEEIKIDPLPVKIKKINEAWEEFLRIDEKPKKAKQNVEGKPVTTRTKTIEEIVLEDLVESMKAQFKDNEKVVKRLENKIKKLEKVIEDIKDEKEGRIKFIKDNPDFLEIS